MKNSKWNEVVYKDMTGAGADLTFFNVVVLLVEAIIGYCTIFIALWFVLYNAMDWIWDKGEKFINWIRNRKESKKGEEESE